MQTKTFVNFSNEEFIGYWDSVPYRIKPGQAVMFEDWKAEHFAKHLVDRELQKLGKEINDQSRQSFVDKCFVAEVEENEELADLPEETKLLNQKKKPGRPKKEVKEEESFEGLE